MRGLALVEVLVSLTILALAVVIALAVYDRSRRAFQVAENVAEQQQAVRVAFDLLIEDLRATGLNTNPDRSALRPDEPLEALFDTAVTLRADFDGHDPALSEVPEQALAGLAFQTVSTANDEIHTYVLAKANGSSNDVLTFEADTGPGPRDGVVETVTVPGVALAHDDPPYTLYRVRLDEDGTPTRTPLIDNVRALSFRYHDGAGNSVLAIGGTDAPADVRARGGVRRITVELEALTRDPDPAWEDTADPDPRTRAYRKFRLTGDVTPRNLGRIALRDEGGNP